MLNKKYCRLCKLVRSNDNDYCSKCGGKLSALDDLPSTDACCPKCEKIQTKDGDFCVKCGTRLENVNIPNNGNKLEDNLIDINYKESENNVHINHPLNEKQKKPLGLIFGWGIFILFVLFLFNQPIKDAYNKSEFAHKRIIAQYYKNIYTEGNYAKARQYISDRLRLPESFFINQEKNVNDFLFSNNVNFQGVRVQKVVGRSNTLPTYRVRVELLVNGEEVITDAEYMAIVDYGELKITFRGWESQGWGVDDEVANDTLDMVNIYIFESVIPKQYIIMFDYHNTTSNDYQIGWVNQGNLRITIINRNTTFTTSINRGLTLKKNSVTFMSFIIDDVSVDLLDRNNGDLRLTVTNLIKLNNNGLPVNSDTTGVDQSVYLIYTNE